ncbi:glucan 1,3-beta-glucosidase [Colletotrichum plurivorum]|uniref:Glucan 1,3-beta-glucosidase n=1 Tax=Colletotrichum plurivorum TaxID=2175906 RepID=A0A8H6JD73_9PEZI|nr:glucan 1,3-beta-glucosidase [Colletotrichum plurivorum]
MASKTIFWLAAATAAIQSIATLPPLPAGYSSPGLPVGQPLPATPYVVDNTGNTHNAAPDKGTLDKLVTTKEERLQLKKPVENGSGGFLSDLTFYGGNIGFRAGSQQYTAQNLQFTSCLAAISMIWDWGFTWQNIYVYSCWVAIDCTSTLTSMVFRIPSRCETGAPTPNIVLDNLLVENSASIVLVSGGETIFEGSSGQTYFTSWAMGSRCSSKSGKCSFETGLFDPAPRKPQSLLDGSGNIFTRSKPTYTNYGASSFVVVTAQGVKNDGTGDQSEAISAILKDAAGAGRPVFFPSGVYLIEKTVFIPVGSIIIGEAWSQIMGTGAFFSDESKPQPVIRVGNVGDSGVIEISDMMWTVKGGTAGAILMQWNVHESTKGSAAMWDSHFQVGGAVGSDLRLDDCPKSTGAAKKDCIAASMLFHVTSRGSGYFENVWVWTADHDMDVPHRYIEDGNTTTSVQINIYTAIGTFIESQGPTWLYGTGSEHHVIQNAKDVFLTHIQTETPYFQASTDALQPFKSYDQGFLDTESCQERLAETSFSEGLWFYNTFIKGAVQVIKPRGGIPPLMQKDTDQV